MVKIGETRRDGALAWKRQSENEKNWGSGSLGEVRVVVVHLTRANLGFLLGLVFSDNLCNSLSYDLLVAQVKLIFLRFEERCNNVADVVDRKDRISATNTTDRPNEFVVSPSSSGQGLQPSLWVEN